MLFSFVRNRRGRILLAHCSKGRLIVQMSPLYPFNVREEGWDGFLALFTRYQVAGPSSADTTNVPAGSA